MVKVVGIQEVLITSEYLFHSLRISTKELFVKQFLTILGLDVDHVCYAVTGYCDDT